METAKFAHKINVNEQVPPIDLIEGTLDGPQQVIPLLQSGPLNYKG